MIITCPNCQTRYQVATNAIGSAGRKVQCAHCHQSWQAVPEAEPVRPKPKLVEMPPPAPETDRIFGAEEEAALDAAFTAEDRETAPASSDAAAPAARKDEPDGPGSETDQEKFDRALAKSRKAAFHRRQRLFARGLPTGRLRMQARMLAAVLLLALFVGGYAFRTGIVGAFPSLADIYSAVGIEVNVTGLEFRNVDTLRSFKDGSDTTEVTGYIRNVTDRPVKVPSVVVSLRDRQGASLYSWRFKPSARTLGPAQRVKFETQLNAAPQNAHTIRLEFADGRAD